MFVTGISQTSRALEGALQFPHGSAMKTKLYIQPKSCRAVSQRVHTTAHPPQSKPLSSPPIQWPDPCGHKLPAGEPARGDASQLQRCSGASSPTARQEPLRTAGANPRPQPACQLVARPEHGLKQLRQFLSRISAPRGSKSARCSLDTC